MKLQVYRPTSRRKLAHHYYTSSSANVLHSNCSGRNEKRETPKRKAGHKREATERKHRASSKGLGFSVRLPPGCLVGQFLDSLAYSVPTRTRELLESILRRKTRTNISQTRRKQTESQAEKARLLQEYIIDISQPLYA